MTTTIKKVPAILLAVIVAAALVFGLGVMQPSHAEATSNQDYFVFVDPTSSDLRANYEQKVLPGETVQVEASIYDSENVSPVGGYVRYYVTDVEWHVKGLRLNEISGDYEEFDLGPEVAKVEVDPVDPMKANVVFGILPLGADFQELKVYATMKIFDTQYESYSSYFTMSRDFYQIHTAEPVDPYQMKGEEQTINAQVLHYSVGNEPQPVTDAVFTWYYNGLTGPAQGSNIVVKRDTEDMAFMEVEAVWEGNDPVGAGYTFEEVSADLKNYTLETDKYVVFMDDDEGYDPGYTPEIDVIMGNHVLKEGKDYELQVWKYIGYDSNYNDKFEPYDKKFPLTITNRNHPDPADYEPVDINGNKVRGVGIYKIVAVGKDGTAYAGTQTTDGSCWLYIYSKSTLNFYNSYVEFNSSYLKEVDAYPEERYEVTPGTKLTPSVEIDSKDGYKKLTANKDYKVEYYSLEKAGNPLTSFPTAIGTYQVVVTGIGDYYGTNDTRFVKVGKKNPTVVNGKTVKMKKNKKTKTLSAKKVFKVKKQQGKLTYEKVSGNSKITVASNGKVKVKKGLKKGKTYKVKVQVTSPGNGTYNSYSKNVTFKIKIK